MDRLFVAAELLKVAKDLTAFEFPTDEALKKYLKDHPAANRSNHTVKKTEKDSQPAKPINIHKHFPEKYGDKAKPQQKDHDRIESMVSKSMTYDGKSDTIDSKKIMQHAGNMAKAIDDPAKAYRRGEAAMEKAYDPEWGPTGRKALKEVAEAFYQRAEELSK